MKFIWLEIHSACSMEAGNIFISDLASFAAKHGFSWVGLADSNGFYGLLPFISACREKNLKALVSVRIKTPVADALLVARSMRGYAHLCRIITLGLANDAALKGEIIKNCQNNFMVISADFPLVKECRENGFAEINPLMSDYFTAYQRAHAEKLEPVLIYPVYFISPADYRITRILSAVRLNKKLDSLSKEDCISEEAYFLSEEEICRRYAHMPDALDNTVKIAQKVFFEFNTGGIIMPEFTGGDFYTLKNLVEKNLPRRYAEPIPAAVLKRLKDELAVIREKNFAGYFLIVHDIVKKQAFTCGRGSGAASLVAYLLYITHVDPVKHCLFFERFLNLHREDPPDIDIDFPWDTRDQVLEYVFEKYGTAHAAMVANHVTFSLRSALRECAKIRSLEETEISRAAQSITHYYHCKKDQTITRVSRQGGAWAEIYRDALPLCGILRYLSVHCGGVVITPKPVSYYAPVEKAPKGVPVIQFDKDQAEDFGLVKIDLLGNRSLAVARDALSMIEKNYNIKISYADFNPLDDQKTISLLAAGNSMGVFYVESPAMRQLQKKTGHGDFEHLVIHSSMIRPAANRYIREYIARLHGKPWQPLLPEMKELLAETFGIMCYQEDITKTAMAIADFSLQEAEELRKIISNPRKKKRLAELKILFFERLQKKQISLEITGELWGMIESFAGYSFCKPHSASYALLSFKCAWLKCHYPAEFMAAVLKNRGGYYSPFAYISEARRMGLCIVPPDINISSYYYYGKERTIYMGFQEIKGLTAAAGKIIEEDRFKNGQYKNLYEFLNRTQITRADADLLINAGACFSPACKNSAQLSWLLNRYFTARPENTDGFFFRASADEPKPPPLRALNSKQISANEQNCYGFNLSVHPLKPYREYLNRLGIIRACDLPLEHGIPVKTAGICITAKTVMARNGDLMQFVTFEDETALIETVFFPRAYRKFSIFISAEKPQIITGRVQIEFGVMCLEVIKLEKI